MAERHVIAHSTTTLQQGSSTLPILINDTSSPPTDVLPLDPPANQRPSPIKHHLSQRESSPTSGPSSGMRLPSPSGRLDVLGQMTSSAGQSSVPGDEQRNPTGSNLSQAAPQSLGMTQVSATDSETFGHSTGYGGPGSFKTKQVELSVLFNDIRATGSADRPRHQTISPPLSPSFDHHPSSDGTFLEPTQVSSAKSQEASNAQDGPTQDLPDPRSVNSHGKTMVDISRRHPMSHSIASVPPQTTPRERGPTISSGRPRPPSPHKTPTGPDVNVPKESNLKDAHTSAAIESMASLSPPFASRPPITSTRGSRLGSIPTYRRLGRTNPDPARQKSSSPSHHSETLQDDPIESFIPSSGQQVDEIFGAHEKEGSPLLAEPHDQDLRTPSPPRRTSQSILQHSEKEEDEDMVPGSCSNPTDLIEPHVFRRLRSPRNTVPINYNEDSQVDSQVFSLESQQVNRKRGRNKNNLVYSSEMGSEGDDDIVPATLEGSDRDSDQGSSSRKRPYHGRISNTRLSQSSSSRAPMVEASLQAITSKTGPSPNRQKYTSKRARLMMDQRQAARELRDDEDLSESSTEPEDANDATYRDPHLINVHAPSRSSTTSRSSKRRRQNKRSAPSVAATSKSSIISTDAVPQPNVTASKETSTRVSERSHDELALTGKRKRKSTTASLVQSERAPEASVHDTTTNTTPRNKHKALNGTHATKSTHDNGLSHRVWAPFRGDFYPGRVTSSTDKNRCEVKFDDGDVGVAKWQDLRRCELEPGDFAQVWNDGTGVKHSLRNVVIVKAYKQASLGTKDIVEVKFATDKDKKDVAPFGVQVRNLRIRDAQTREMGLQWQARRLGGSTVPSLSPTSLGEANNANSSPLSQSPSMSELTAGTSDDDDQTPFIPASSHTTPKVFQGYGFFITSTVRIQSTETSIMQLDDSRTARRRNVEEQEKLRHDDKDKQKKQSLAKLISKYGGVWQEDIWDFYSKPLIGDLKRGYKSVRLKRKYKNLRGIFLIVMGKPAMTTKFLMALALGIPCLSEAFIKAPAESVSREIHFEHTNK